MDLFGNTLVASTQDSTINHYRDLAKDNELYFNDEYQRKYVWQHEQQQNLLNSIFNGIPLPAIAATLNPNSDPSEYFEVVDGRQRITTLVLFFNNEIAYHTDNKQIFWRDMTKPQQRQFRSVHLPYNELYRTDSKAVTLKDKLEYFLRINFGGTPQSLDHKEKLIRLYNEQ